jgi:hypothetical protein
VDARGRAESNDKMRDQSIRLPVEGDRKSDNTNGSIREPNFAAMNFPPLPGASEIAAVDKSSAVRVSNNNAAASVSDAAHVTAKASKVGQGFPNAHEHGALASSPKYHNRFDAVRFTYLSSARRSTTVHICRIE